MEEKTRLSIDHSIIIAVFGLAGLTSAYLCGRIMEALSLEAWTAPYFFVYIIFFVPLYFILLLSVAAVFGKFNFFYCRQKRILKKIAEFLK